MGKLIAVWGSPDSGKTTFSVKLAEALYNRSRGKSAVIVVFTDIVTPTIPVIFPNFRSEDVFSVGTILTKPDFFADDVVSNMVMTKDRMNLGYLGYKDSENKHSFAFLETCLRYGVSFVVAGRTSSGKTTLLNSLLGSIPDSKRIYTIESGARELSLVKRDEQGRVINNVVHTLSRPSDKDIADMRSGNEEVALTRLESRVGSTMMSDVTRGLIGVVRGDDMEVYWGTTALKFADYQREQLKAQANAVPRKVRKLSMALLFCFILIYVAVLGQVLLTSMGTLF